MRLENSTVLHGRIVRGSVSVRLIGKCGGGGHTGGERRKVQGRTGEEGMARNGIERGGLSEQRECTGRRSKAHTNLELFLQIVKGATVATHVSRPLIRHDDGGLGSGRGDGGWNVGGEKAENYGSTGSVTPWAGACGGAGMLGGHGGAWLPASHAAQAPRRRHALTLACPHVREQTHTHTRAREDRRAHTNQGSRRRVAGLRVNSSMPATEAGRCEVPNANPFKLHYRQGAGGCTLLQAKPGRRRHHPCFLAQPTFSLVLLCIGHGSSQQPLLQGWLPSASVNRYLNGTTYPCKSTVHS